MLTEAEKASLRERHYNATLTRVVECAPGLRILAVRLDAGPARYAPGQYTALGLGVWEPAVDGGAGEEVRPEDESRVIRGHYSFSHPILDPSGKALLEPDALRDCEFYVALPERRPGDRAIRFAPRLFALKEGDRIFMPEKPAGGYTLDGILPGEEILFAATGTGEAPHNTMIWHLLGSGHGGRIASIVCTRFADNQGYRAVHERLESLFDRYVYVPLTTREPGAGGRRTHIQDLLRDGSLADRIGWMPEAGRAHVFLCGNPAMIGAPDMVNGVRTYPRPEGVVEILESRGFSSDGHTGGRIDLHFERFW